MSSGLQLVIHLYAVVVCGLLPAIDATEICQEGYHVQGGECSPCPSSTSRLAGDVVADGDSECLRTCTSVEEDDSCQMLLGDLDFGDDGSTDLQKANYPSLTHINGTVSFSHPYLEAIWLPHLQKALGLTFQGFSSATLLSIEFPALVSVMGDFLFTAQLPKVSTLSFDTLTFVGGDFKWYCIAGMEQMKELDFSSLRRVDGDFVFKKWASVCGYGFKLVTANFFSLHTVGGYFWFHFHHTTRQLSNLNFSSLVSVGQYFKISIGDGEQQALLSLDFPSLSVVHGSFSINAENHGPGRGAWGLVKVRFPSLHSIEGDFSITGDSGNFPALSEVEFPLLTNVDGHFNIYEDARPMSGFNRLFVLSFPNLMLVDGQFHVERLQSLSVLGVPSLSNVSGNVIIRMGGGCGVITAGCPAVANTVQLSSLTNVKGEVDIQGSSNITANFNLGICIQNLNASSLIWDVAYATIFCDTFSCSSQTPCYPAACAFPIASDETAWCRPNLLPGTLQMLSHEGVSNATILALPPQSNHLPAVHTTLPSPADVLVFRGSLGVFDLYPYDIDLFLVTSADPRPDASTAFLLPRSSWGYNATAHLFSFVPSSAVFPAGNHLRFALQLSTNSNSPSHPSKAAYRHVLESTVRPLISADSFGVGMFTLVPSSFAVNGGNPGKDHIVRYESELDRGIIHLVIAGTNLLAGFSAVVKTGASTLARMAVMMESVSINTKESHECTIINSTAVSLTCEMRYDKDVTKRLLFSPAVTIAGVTRRSSDTLMLLPYPIELFSFSVPSESSCTLSTRGLVDCPTVNGPTVVLRGRHFRLKGESDPLLSLNGRPQESRALNATDEIVFHVPPGVGTVQVSLSNGQRKSDELLIVYLKPTLIKIEAQCGLDKLNPCSREGGVPITLHGANFGPQDATVEVILVGGGQKMAACNDTAHDEESPHEVLTCILPAGRLFRQVMVITASGTSSTEATIHYQRCAAGSHQDDSEDKECVACEPGKYRSAEPEQLELTECIPCKAGFEPNPGHAECDPCSPGRSSLNGSSCEQCEDGYFSKSAASQCDPCNGVTGIAINNGTDCQPCPALSSLMQDGQCGCKAGYMFVSSDSSDSDADVGEFGSDIGRGRCQECPSGRFSKKGSSCERCEDGYFSKAAASQCDPCNGVKGIAINNGTDCQPCPALSSLMQDGQCGCKAGYMFVFSENGADVGEFGSGIGRGRCQQCPSGADCREQGIRQSTVKPLTGYYALENNLAFQRCLSAEACPGKAKCMEGHTSLLCAKCLPGFFRTGELGCVTCGSHGSAVAILILGALGAVAVLVLLIYNVRKSSQLPKKTYAILLKILLNFMQSLSLATDFNFRFPSAVKSFLLIGGALSFDTAATNVGCLLSDPNDAFYVKTVLFMMLPAVLALMVAVFWLLYGKCTPDHETLKRQVVSSLVAAFMVVYITVTRSTLNVFLCTSIGDNQRLVYYDVDSSCFGSSHLIWALLVAMPSLLFFVVGFPLALLRYLRKLEMPAVLHRWNHGQQTDEDKVIMEKFSYVIKGYHPKFCYWEFVILIRKVLIMGIALFSPNQGSKNDYVQYTLMSVLMTSCILLQHKCQPFQEQDVNDAELHTLFVISFFYMGGQLLTADDIGEFGLVVLSIALIAGVTIFTVLFVRNIFIQSASARGRLWTGVKSFRSRISSRLSGLQSKSSANPRPSIDISTTVDGTRNPALEVEMKEIRE